MDALTKLLDRVVGARLQDILLPGFLDHDAGVPTHVSWLSTSSNRSRASSNRVK